MHVRVDAWGRISMYYYQCIGVATMQGLMHEAAEAVSKGMNVLRGTLGREGEKAAGSGVLSGIKETGKVGERGSGVDLSR